MNENTNIMLELVCFTDEETSDWLLLVGSISAINQSVFSIIMIAYEISTFVVHWPISGNVCVVTSQPENTISGSDRILILKHSSRTPHAHIFSILATIFILMNYQLVGILFWKEEWQMIVLAQSNLGLLFFCKEVYYTYRNPLHCCLYYADT